MIFIVCVLKLIFSSFSKEKREKMLKRKKKNFNKNKTLLLSLELFKKGLVVVFWVVRLVVLGINPD